MFTAHIREYDKAVQSVKEHCLNTAELAYKYAEPLGLGNVAYVQGLLHDIGKNHRDFDAYIKGDSGLKRGDIDHSYAGAKYICEFADGIDTQKYHNVSRFIARTIISHHGLHDWITADGQDYFIKRISNADRYEAIKESVKDIVSESELRGYLEKAYDEYTVTRARIKDLSKASDDFAFYLGLLERLMQSVLIDADRTDTADFISGKKSETIYTGKTVFSQMQKSLNEQLKRFSKLDDPISMQRMSISDRCEKFAAHHVGICRLIVPTGGGKTLSSLRFAIEYAKNYDLDRIFYTAPFTSILEQNSERIKSIAGEENFLEHHSNVVLENETAEELNRYELRTEKWDMPVIATTMVQLLCSLFSGKSTSVRRMHRLCRSVIIIDEIQSLPVKCVYMFNLAVNFLARIGQSAIVLCSATQPTLDETKYPLLIDDMSSMTGDHSKDFAAFRRTNIISKVTPYGYTYDDAAGFCSECFDKCKNLLVVVNTKAAAKTLYELLKERYDGCAEIVHLSTSMCPEHRREKIKQLMEDLECGKRLICVTTQLIEAGVDISFSCVVRSLAGLDNAAQAAGRCNRHGESPEPCPVYIINIRDEKLGTLGDIKTAQNISDQLFDNPAYSDYQSPETLSVYFKKLYAERKNDLAYSVMDGGDKTSLLKLLSLDKHRYDVSSKTCSRYSAQAFKTAGNKFEVISNNTVDVIVPYNEEAEDIIAELNSEITPDRCLKLLRRAQKYTVGIYNGTNIKLCEQNALYLLNCGAFALKKEFYNHEYGVTTEGALQELLIF